MPGRPRKRTPQVAPVKEPMSGSGVSLCSPGDLVRVQLSHNPAMLYSTLLLRAERCDERRGIVFGTIMSDSFGVGRALSRGAKLAVAFHLVRENLQVVSPKEEVKHRL